MSKDSLKPYLSRRDFRSTPEPKGLKGPSLEPKFVIQKHDARKLHYDFRLEVEGILKSWAVPKGPSLNPSDKRLSIPTEDHPLEYADFEGVIPKGQYGAGTVMVWDAGPYRNLNQKDSEQISMSKAIQNGHVTFWLEGKKLKGGYALIRTGSGGGEKERWLLVKMNDREADPSRDPVATEPRSVLSGRTIEEIQGENKIG